MNLFTKEESFDESKLHSDGQKAIAKMVKALPEEDLSMAWRSSLNVKLLAAQNAKKKQRLTKRIFAWGSSLSAGVAATAYFVLMANTTAAPPVQANLQSSSFASELVRTHQESVVLASVSGTGSSVHETSLTEDMYTPIDEML